jgi:hypothetical protein
MADPTVQQLFRKWRQGDAESGQDMAQKFSDWYYAITTIRVADKSGRQPLEQACQAFAQGIVSVTRPSSLVDWAHDLLERELQAIGRGLDAGTATGGDHPNALTKNRSPTSLLQQAVGHLDPAHAQLLAMAYDIDQDLAEVQAVGDAMGGLPFALLDARYALKRALHSAAKVPFSVLPEQADMDRAPISLYEAGRLASAGEIVELEKWLITDIDLCKDVAEFAAFVHALRGGALSGIGTSAAAPAPEPVAQAPAPTPPEASAPEPSAPEPSALDSQPGPFTADAANADLNDDEVPQDGLEEDDGFSLDLGELDEGDTLQPAPVGAEDAPAVPAKVGSWWRDVLWTAMFVFLAVVLLLGGAAILLRWG